MIKQTNMFSKKGNKFVVSILYASKVVQGWQVIIYTNKESVTKTGCVAMRIQTMRKKNIHKVNFLNNLFNL